MLSFLTALVLPGRATRKVFPDLHVAGLSIFSTQCTLSPLPIKSKQRFDIFLCNYMFYYCYILDDGYCVQISVVARLSLAHKHYSNSCCLYSFVYMVASNAAGSLSVPCLELKHKCPRSSDKRPYFIFIF